MKANRKPNGRPPRRAVGVVRISKNRDDETSTTTQTEKITAYCVAHDLELVEVVTDAGRSAYNDTRSSRPGLRRARQLVKAGAADVMVVWKIDRAARNNRDLLNLIHELKEDGGTFASVTESFDTSTPTGNLVLNVLGAIAEMESAIKAERTAAWNEYRASTGAVPTGPRPFGYAREHNALLVVEAEAEVVRRAAKGVLAGASIRSLVKKLNERAGCAFTETGLKRILTSPTTAALRDVDGTMVSSDAWEPILDRRTWDEVRAVLTDPTRRTNGGAAARAWLLPGLAVCGKCGRPMKSKNHPAGKRYTCPTEHNSIPAADTDRVVAGIALSSLDLRAWRRLQARSRGRHRADTYELEERLADLARRVADHEITETEWEIRRAALIRDLEDAAAEPVALPDVDNPRTAWPELSIDARRLILTAVLPMPITILPATLGRPFDEARIVIPSPPEG